MFDREAAIRSCKAIAALGLVMVALGAATYLFVPDSRDWTTLGLFGAVFGATLLVLSGVAFRLLRRH